MPRLAFEPPLRLYLGRHTEATWAAARSRVFNRALRDWAERFSLTDAWIGRTAWNTIAMWHAHEVTGDWIFPTALRASPIDEDSLRITHEFLVPDPFIASWDESLTNALVQDFKAKLSAARRDLLNTSRLRGLTSTPLRRDLTRDFEWLVLFQVRRATQSELAKRWKTSRETVGESIRSLAQQVGLTLRQASGRPRRGSGSSP